MNRLTVSACAATLLLACSSTALGQGRHCSAALVSGEWAFTTTGSIRDIGPVSAVGSYKVDRLGNVTGSQTRSLNGDVANEGFSGTVTVNADCTGVDVIQVYQSGILVRTSTLNVVYDDNGRGARAIFKSLVLSNGVSLYPVLTIEARKLFPGGGTRPMPDPAAAH